MQPTRRRCSFACRSNRILIDTTSILWINKQMKLLYGRRRTMVAAGSVTRLMTRGTEKKMSGTSAPWTGRREKWITVRPEVISKTVN